MTVSFDSTDPIHMTPEQRLTEVAAILAAGFHRLRRKAALPGCPPTPSNPQESEQNCLDEWPESRLHGHQS